MKLHFLGANRQVTGSRYLLEAGGLRIMIDCGMFQERQFQKRNWQTSPIDPASIDVMLLTHAHLDHSGLIPRLVAQGFDRPIYTTTASVDLARLVLEDAARIQNEDVAYKEKRHAKQNRRSQHPYEPLYSIEDTQRALRLFRGVSYAKPVQLNEAVSVTYHDAGHILGSAMLDIQVHEAGQVKRIVFSGDLGQWDTPLIQDPTLLRDADYVVMESTYGDRDHDSTTSIEDQLAAIVTEAQERGGNVVIPTFAIERAQEMLYYFSKLRAGKRIAPTMVFLDSPMAVDATRLFARNDDYLDDEALAMLRQRHSPFRFEGLVMARSREQSKAINHLRGSCVIMAGSGMATGGRVKHHLLHNLGREEATILFVGYQSRGTLGREILEGAHSVRVLGEQVTVRAKVTRLLGLSAHADRKALIRWISNYHPQPKRLFLTHGEESASKALATTLQQELNLTAEIPDYEQVVELA